MLWPCVFFFAEQWKSAGNHSRISYPKWLDIKLQNVGNPRTCEFGHQQFGVKIHCDVVKASVCLKTPRPCSFHEQILDAVTQRSHKVLSHQSEVRVEVETGACVALRSEVLSEEGLLVLMELCMSWIDGYSPEVLLLFFSYSNSEKNQSLTAVVFAAT